MNPEKVIKRAIKLLQPIKYEPFAVGYFVKKDDNDMGGQDFCINCIDDAVASEVQLYKKNRTLLVRKLNKLSKMGAYYDKSKREWIPVKEYRIKKVRREMLKGYPEKVTFSYEGHDPDFGGGLQEPCYCGDCGEYFSCNFEPNKDEANHLLHILSKSKSKITDKDKWEMDIALSNYEYVKDDVKTILYKVAECVIIRLAK